MGDGVLTLKEPGGGAESAHLDIFLLYLSRRCNFMTFFFQALPWI